MELVNYSKSQEEAIKHHKGPLMVIAGPGSGKTFVISTRVKYLQEAYGVNPLNIMLVTFSREAAKEMKERSIKLKKESSKITCGTFHAIFFHILKKAYGENFSQLASEELRIEIIEKLLLKHKGLNVNILENVNKILSEISILKQERLNKDLFFSKTCSKEVFIDIYEEYEKALKSLKKIDFDDMLLLAYELLSQREDVRKACSNKYKYILVDEFQDINMLQYSLLKLLLDEEKNLTIVGDDDQSIYSFRGANPKIMLDFHKDFKDVKRVVLDINFRSKKQVVETALKLIKNNKERFFKNIVSSRGSGKDVEIISFSNNIKQVAQIVEDIKSYIQLGYKYSDIAILYRTNIQPRLLVEKLYSLLIPFRLKDGMPNIYSHFIAKDILAYLNLAYGEFNRKDLLRIINKPLRYIKREVLEDENINFDSLKRGHLENKSVFRNIVELENSLRVIRSLSLKKALSFIRKGINYNSYISDYCEYNNLESSDFMGVLDEIELLAGEYKDFKAWLTYINKTKENLISTNVEDGVNLMTFHASKGLEFKIVYIIDVNKDIVPHKKAKTEYEIEEERRAFYVAITRARDRLIISRIKNNKDKPSIFIEELLKKV